MLPPASVVPAEQKIRRQWWEWLLLIIGVAGVGSLLYGCFAIIKPINHATDPNRHEQSDFNVTSYDKIGDGSQYSHWYRSTLHLVKVDSHVYECWLTTDIEDLNEVTLLETTQLAYPLGTILKNLWYNPDGNSCGFDESPAVSGRAALVIACFSLLAVVLSTTLVTWWCCCRPRPMFTKEELQMISAAIEPPVARSRAGRSNV